MKAGAEPASFLSKLTSNIFFPMYIYFFAWPWVKTLLWGPPEVPYGPITADEWAKIDPDDFYNSWAYSAIKTGFIMLSLVVTLLIMIYVGQEKILYVPAQPIQYIEDNPPRYKSPEERGIQYEEVWLNSRDGTKLQGWFMHHGSTTQHKDTIIFLHENAGNIGLRLDWFELTYHKLDINILSVAYRGYSRSEGTPEEAGILQDAEAMIEFCKGESRIN